MKYRDTVLFVDDEENILSSLRRGLIDEEYNCLFAQSGQQALDILKKEPVSVIVSDMRMPGMDGLSLLNEVKAKYPKTVRIVLSGYAQIQQVLATVNQADIFRFITKPWKLEEEFKGVIRQALDYHRLQVERDEFSESLVKQNQAYQGILKKMEEILAGIKKNAEISSFLGKTALDFLYKELGDDFNSKLIRKRLETVAVVFQAATGIFPEELTPKSFRQIKEDMEQAICGENIKEITFEAKFDEALMLKANHSFLTAIVPGMIKLFAGESKSNQVKMFIQMENGMTDQFGISLVVSNLSEVNTVWLKNSYDKIQDSCIDVLNYLLGSVAKMLNGSFSCARVDINTIAKLVLNGQLVKAEEE